MVHAAIESRAKRCSKNENRQGRHDRGANMMAGGADSGRRTGTQVALMDRIIQ
jgi:hypothetical protein